MKRFVSVSAALLGLFVVGYVNGFDFEDFHRRTPLIPHELFNDNPTGFWPFQHFTHKAFFPNSRRVADDDSSEEVLAEPGNSEPLDIDSISGSIGNPDDVHAEIESHHTDPFSSFDPSGLFFHQSFNPFANPFGVLNGMVPRQQPWWRGPNVCTQRQEDIEDIKGANDDSGEERKSNRQTFHFGVHLTLNSCVERSHKHVCKSVVNENGKTKTVSITRQCCHGYGRQNDADVSKTCEKLNLVSVMETSEKLGGKEFVKAAKNNGLEDMLTKKNVTVFLPTDASFTDYSEQMFESNLVVIPQAARRRRSAERDYLSGFTSKDLALNHIVDDWIDIQDIENEQILQTQYENLTIRMNIYPRPPNDDSYAYAYRYTANCAPIVKVNQIAENGIVHMVDRVLSPVTKNLMELVRSRSDMAVLRTVLEKTNLAELLEKDTKHFTLFAPNDKAFGKLNEHLRRTMKSGNECAMNIIKNHILEMSFCSVAVVDGVRTGAENALGLRLNLERADNDAASENEIADLTGIKSIIINGKAKIVETDLVGTNGILHVIDTVLPTDSGLPISTMLESHNLTIFGDLIENGGFADEFDSLMNVSFFVPKDEAFDGSEWVKMLKENPEALKGNEELKSFLTYHIAKPLTKTCDLTEEVMKTENGNGLRINLYSTHSILNNVMNRATINCARLVHFDDITCGSVVHQVDRILTPPTTSLLGALEANDNYSMFLQLIKKSNLTQMLDDVNQNLTMLVPTNDIFREVKEFYDELLENRNQLEHFVRLHVLDDVLCCAGIVQTQWPFVRVVKTINDYELKLSRDRRPKIQNAGITKCDIIAKNGVILEVNDMVSAKRKESQIEDFNTFLNI